ncbi:MAG: mannose-6-phosphate isomerase, class I [Butyrivibrio sp.]|uniref:mannose-6-phosphate isomerase, class I n=1 Tax=Butyrivibrio sp. TaxID=28121 RepID=UPI0025D0E276|nr:mannose-6-phosphate isomerase, class I [Butyrivibrio sp.]MCR5770330.1 mannose-6-phosphate isomerase, class I [Butyrivibrio sp.]
MFREDFIWGVAASSYQTEGRDQNDGAGLNIWDDFIKKGAIADGSNADIACDMIHRYKEDFAIMRMMGIKAYRFSISWSRLIPDGTGEVNKKAVALYRDMLLCMKENGIRPFITLFHWEYPLVLEEKGGWVNPESSKWFERYAEVVGENFSDLCDDFITFNEPQCTISLGYVKGFHAPGKKLPLKDTLFAAHNLLKAHGLAVKALRRTAPNARVGYAPTCGVAYPDTDSREDIEAARKRYFGFDEDKDNWAWNVSWFLDPVILGRYPEEGIELFKDDLFEITDEDMELISQPIDFIGQNIYNGYPISAGENGKIIYAQRERGYNQTAMTWPVTPSVLYWGPKFLYERYHKDIFITENGMAACDIVAPDGAVHDGDRIAFLDKYISNLQKAADEGVSIVGYFHWSYCDNFEWTDGYAKRFGLVYVDYTTLKRTIKDSGFWYKKVMETNGKILSINNSCKEPLFLEPHFTHNIWGGSKLRDVFGYNIEGDDIGECWGIAAHTNGTATVKNGMYKGMGLDELYRDHSELFGTKHDRFPLLTKIIDAKSDLSIQVHPDDAYAAENENGSLGKTECWYVLDCDDDASLVVGHNAATRQELSDMMDQGRWSDLIREVKIKKGDFIQIDPGTVHAIKGGVVVLETQQNSDITYRLYDYDRIWNGSKRELHVDKCKDVITVPAKDLSDAIIHDTDKEQGIRLLNSCKYYEVSRVNVTSKLDIEVSDKYLLFSVIEGTGLLGSHPLKKGDHFILPVGFGTARFAGDMKLIMSCEALVEAS